MDRYAQAVPDRVYPSLSLRGPGAPPLASVRESLQEGRFAVLREVTAQYAPDDPSFAPYWALAAELDVPVGIQKRDIFFNNAARFLRLSPSQVTSMRGKVGD